MFLNDVTKYLKDKKFLILSVLACLLVGLFYTSNHIISFCKLGAEGKKYFPLTLEAGPATEFYDEVLLYAPNAKEFFEGHKYVSNADAFEYINGPAVRHILSSFIMSPFFYFGGATNFVAVSDFIFPVFSFALLAVLFFLLTSKKYLSLIGATIVSLATKLSLYLFPLDFERFKNLIKHFVPGKIDMWIPSNEDLAKMEAMKPGMPFFLCFFIFLFLTIKKENKIYPVLTGVSLGLLFYTYSYHWIFAVIAAITASFLLLVNKNFSAIKKIFTIGAVSAFISLPFWFNFFWQSLLPNYQEYGVSIGMEVSRAIRWDLLPEFALYVSMAYAIWKLYKNKNKATAVFVSSLLLSLVAVFYIQIITGFQFQSNHWFSKVVWLVLAIGWFVIGCAFFEWTKKLKCFRFIKLSLFFVFCILVFNAFLGRFIYASERYEKWQMPDNLMESFEWLNRNTPLDSVVATPSLTAVRYFPLYTNNKIYLPFYENAPSDEILDRLYIMYKIFDIPENYFDEVFFKGKKGEIIKDSQWSDVNFYEKRGLMYVYGFKYPNGSKEEENAIKNGYINYPNYKLNYILNKYRIDYIYYGPHEKKMASDANLSKNKYLEQVYDEDGIEIYKINFDKLTNKDKIYGK